ncbi:MAG TPA: glycosyltransferase family 2 protein [Bacteroidales bacterium]|jgi:glycosyltransferase involved in cell wall biosynthesis|nr:glycosyltransferase family 2 protein [Bacteroidales bacterium]MDY0161558.1 glycosyltransferase family 2 protein [Bacteroidales bacterium]HRW21056.1 glycosyltransferase family 2 protein [Bacteroidales bacterium]HXK81444.1 glycosyltransferase family 2 protein [Bacteroidales bacterium]
MDISIVIPLYNEEESLPELVEWISQVMTKHNHSFEIIMVDDGSNDDSWKVIESLSVKYPQLRAVKFRRNYGKSPALHTAFQIAKGNVIITMDADLQDSPEEIPELYRMIIEDKFDLVSGWKKKRHDPLSKRLPSKFFNRITRITSGIRLHDFNCGLKAYRASVVKSIEIFGEMHRYIPVLAKQAGFKRIGEKVVSHQARKFGKSKFGFERFVNGYLDLLTVLFITRFGKKPMHIFGVLGSILFILGFVSAAYLGIHKLVAMHNGVLIERVTASPYFYLSLVCIVMGTMLFLTGFLGELISRSAADRNHYLIEKEI